MRIITIVGLLSSLFVALTAYAVDLDGQSRTYLHSRETINDDNLLPLFEYLDIRLDEFARPELSFHLGGWVRQDFTDTQSFDQRSFNGDLQYAYLGYHLKQANARVNLGRVLVFDGVASELVDGLSLGSDLRHGFGFSAYGGSPAETDYDDRDGDSIFGGRLSHELPGWYRIGLSYLKEKNDGNDFRSEEGVDVRLFPGKRLEVYGRSIYNEETSGWAEHSYYATFKALDRLRFNSEIVYTSYADYFQAVDDFTNSVFLFAPGILDPREELLLTGAQVQADLTDNLSVTADYKYYDYDIVDNADYYGGSIVYRRPDSWGAGLSVYRMDGYTDRLKYLEARLYGYKKFSSADITVDLFNVNYDEPRDNNEDNAFSASAALGYNLTDSARVAVDVEYAKNPTFDYDYRGFFKFLYDFTIAPLFVAKEGQESTIAAQPAAAPVQPDEEARLIEEGKGIFEKICNTCHGLDRKVIGPALNSVLPAYQGDLEALKAFIGNPTKKNPDYPAMPSLGLKENELQAVATYLLSTVKTAAPEIPVEAKRLAPERPTIPAAVEPPARKDAPPVPAPPHPETPVDPATLNMMGWSDRIANTPADKYIIQVQIAGNRCQILKELEQLLPEFDAMVVPYRVNDWKAYTLLVGTYDSRAEGNVALKTLPPSIQEMKPMVKTLPTIQKGLMPVIPEPAFSRQGGANFSAEQLFIRESSEAIAARIRASVERIRRVPADKYTIQIEIGDNRSAILQDLHRLLPQFDAMVLPYQVRTWATYTLISGIYDSRPEGNEAIHELPSSIRQLCPMVKTLPTIQQGLRELTDEIDPRRKTPVPGKARQTNEGTVETGKATSKPVGETMKAISSDIIVIDRVQQKMAAVTFEHGAHQRRLGQDCTICHHTNSKGDTKMKSCAQCHGKIESVPAFKDAMHKKCQGCHKKIQAQGKAAPTSCTGCHKKQ